jgi:hypothetical protein
VNRQARQWLAEIANQGQRQNRQLSAIAQQNMTLLVAVNSHRRG